MPNYTITRQKRNADDYGCTPFATNQLVGQAASLGNFGSGLEYGALDGDIVWYIDAISNYTVNVDDFEIPGTYPTTVGQTPGIQRTFEGSGLPAPILGAVMEKVSDTRIKVVLFLFPYAPLDITGMPFEMPSSSVDVEVSIVGCANPRGKGVHVQLRHGNTSDTIQTEPVKHRISSDQLDNGLEITQISDDPATWEAEQRSSSYSNGDIILESIIAAPSGHHFTYAPTPSISTNDYQLKNEYEFDENGMCRAISTQVIYAKNN